MASFFHGESNMREPSSDIFMMNLNPFPEPTITSNAHNHHFDNLCFGSQQHGPRDEVEDHISSVSTYSYEGVFRGLTPIYLRAAQELLNEIVNVGNGSHGAKQEPRMSKESAIYGKGDIVGGGHTPGVAAYRQELEMKRAKLISMVEKVEQRYRQYHDQMQTIISSSEQAAGLGSANPYTHMALQTISKKFRVVRDMICLQIKHVNKLLGKKECDEQLKHLGKMAHHHSNAWRPQRVLPENAVSILRSWLFEHFLHPYPRDLDKVMLAKQTGLTKSQVSNWFINARVRVWKPMVEELYLEEMNIEESRKGSNPNEHSTNGSSSKQPYNNSTSDESSNSILPTFYQGFNENETPMPNASSSCSIGRFSKQHLNQANFIHFNGGFEIYHTMVGNGVSLSLGLPHSCDQTFKNIQFGSTSHGTEISGIYPSSTYQIMD
ncbi:PREDICTED: BEL1-like homeodomain protein 5 [Camelina sativa]|uniref:BEL1-like homeodomain protein 5 n=1 Tax=Camelina sativa TaxID=90675 RepID=A0ABM0SY94_CAMSA|nr:PREDICTED: BEL1-like homeodomain protein 5 [Camelina sativa]XP_010417874.1 PREDICTED: BEL1-like homeodomain protein 5 [Camelina sativa]